MNDHARRAQIRAEMDSIEKKHIVPLSVRLKRLRKRKLQLEFRLCRAEIERDQKKKVRLLGTLCNVSSAIKLTAYALSPHTTRYDDLQSSLTGRPNRIVFAA